MRHLLLILTFEAQNYLRHLPLGLRHLLLIATYPGVTEAVTRIKGIILSYLLYSMEASLLTLNTLQEYSPMKNKL